MRFITSAIAAGIVLAATSAAQYNEDFSGTWKLNPAKSEINNLPAAPDMILKIEQKGAVLRVEGGPLEEGPFQPLSYPLDGAEKKQRVGNSTLSTRTKWEGAALLVNTIVSGPQSYTIMERWTKTRDGSRLSVKRTIVRISGESESLLVYENPTVASARPPQTAPGPSAVRETLPVRAQPDQPPPAKAPQPAADTADYAVQSGTRILLSLVSSLNTKHSAPGDRVYLRTTYPVISDGRIVIPPGSYVSGTVTESQRAGRVKGQASLFIRFDSLTLPNGVTRDFRSRVGSADANVDSAEGKMKGEGTKGRDTVAVGGTAATGATIGGLAGQSAKGAGIGGAAGAAAGLIGVLSTRGADLVLPPGSTMEMVLDRDLRYTAVELGR